MKSVLNSEKQSEVQPVKEKTGAISSDKSDSISFLLISNYIQLAVTRQTLFRCVLRSV